MGNTFRFPEWKQLHDCIIPLLDQGETNFSYETLQELAGIDIRSPRGRQQFYRFRAEIQRERRIWFENQPNFGYIIIPANGHVRASSKRVSQGDRKLRLARNIVDYVRDEKLTGDERLAHITYSTVLSQLSRAFLSLSRKLETAASPKRLDIGKPPKWGE